MSWKDLSTASPSTPAGVISTDLVPSTTPESGYRVESSAITAADAEFIRQSNGSRVTLLDPRLQTICGSYVFRLFSENKQQVGFIVSIPHRLRTKFGSSIPTSKNGGDGKETLPLPSEDESVPTGLSTHLCVSPAHRTKTLAMMLIRSVITTGYVDRILTGYHYVTKPRSASYVELRTWYRPLNLKYAARARYSIVVPKKPMEDTGKSALKVAQVLYSTKIEHKHRPTTLDDFSKLQSRVVGVEPFGVAEWQRFGKAPLTWKTILHGGQPKAVGAYRPFAIEDSRNPKDRLRVNAAQLVYLEIAPGLTDTMRVTVMQSLVGIIASEGYVVLHGLCMGPLVGDADRLSLIRNDRMYLDFYNFALPSGTKAEDVNLLYV